MSNEFTMVPAEAMRVIRDVVTHNTMAKHHRDSIALLLISDPGCGKTSMVKQVYDEIEQPLVLMNLADKEPQDIAGMPRDIINEDGEHETVFSKPRFFRMKSGTGIFMDEMTKAAHMMSAITPLIYEHTVGDFSLPKGCTIIGAGNHVGNRAGDQALPSHTENRMCRLTLKFSADNWLEYAPTVGTHPSITGYVRWKRDTAFAFNADAQKNPTPRAWSTCSNVLNLKLNRMSTIKMMAGYVGSGPASAFEAYMRYADALDSPEKIIADPKNARMPNVDNPTEAQGMMYAVASSLIGHASKKTLPAIMTYFERMPSKEFVAYAVQDIMQRYPDLKSAPALQAWKLANHHMFAPVS